MPIIEYVLSSKPVVGTAYTSNLSSLKGSVYGGKEYGVFDGFVNVMNWLYEYNPNSGTLVVWREDGLSQKYTIFQSIFSIKELSFTFDKQMLPVVSFMKSDVCNLYYFDSSLNAFNTIKFLDAKSPKVALNSIHPSHIEDSNVVLAYVKNNTDLYVRLQKDRYTTEHLVKQFTHKIKLYNIGFTNQNRFQYEVLETMV